MSALRYTLEEAQQLLNERECAQQGHKFRIGVSTDGSPTGIACLRCGKSWEMAAP